MPFDFLCPQPERFRFHRLTKRFQFQKKSVKGSDSLEKEKKRKEGIETRLKSRRKRIQQYRSNIAERFPTARLSKASQKELYQGNLS